jgi:phospholipase/carboxylesterase
VQLHDPAATLVFGTPLAKARGAVVLIHGRGSSAGDIAGLADSLEGEGWAFFAPSATLGTWYPQRFLVPTAQNEPWLSSALGVLDGVADTILAGGLSSDRIGFIGFSQGACLALEYAVRTPRRYAWVAGLSGALIGPIDTPRAPGNLEGTPFLLGCAEKDPHIPLEFVESSAATLKAHGADVTKQIYPGAAHTVFRAEIDWLNEHASKPNQR